MLTLSFLRPVDSGRHITHNAPLPFHSQLLHQLNQNPQKKMGMGKVKLGKLIYIIYISTTNYFQIPVVKHFFTFVNRFLV